MGQHPHQDLLLLVDPLAGPQRRAEEPLLPRETALDLPPLAVDAAVLRPAWLAAEPPHHLPPVPRLGPPPARVPPVQWEDRRADTQPLTGQGVVVLGVEGAVTQERVHRAAATGGPHRRLKLRRVLTRAAGDVRREEQVAPGLADGRQLGPGALPPPLVGPLGPPGEVPADVPGLEPGGVDGRPGHGAGIRRRARASATVCPRRASTPFFRAAEWPPSGGWSGRGPSSGRGCRATRPIRGGSAPGRGNAQAQQGEELVLGVVLTGE